MEWNIPKISGPEATGWNVDRLVTVEVKTGGRPGRCIIFPLYEAAVETVGNRPISLVAAEKLVERVKPGDTVVLMTGMGAMPFMPRGETDGPPGVASLARAVSYGLKALPIVLVPPRDFDHAIFQLHARLPDLPIPPSLPFDEERRRLFEAFAQFLLALRVKPLVLFIDDLHWVDRALLDWLAYLVHRMRDEGLLLVVAYRPEDANAAVARERLFEFFSARDGTRIVMLACRGVDPAEAGDEVLRVRRREQVRRARGHRTGRRDHPAGPRRWETSRSLRRCRPAAGRAAP